MTKQEKKKSIYDTKFLKTNETGGHPKYLHANTPHISFFFNPEKYYQSSCLFLNILYDKPRDSISLWLFYVLPAKKGLRHLDQ